MMIRFRLLVLLLAAIPSTLNAQRMPWVGRWVNIDATDAGMFILAFTSDGHVHRLLPAPGFGATYRVEGNRLVMRMSDGSVDTALVVHGDTIMQGERVFLTRLPEGTMASAGVRGTWSAVASAPLEMFMTFRSDGVAVLEVGFPVEAQLHGDTLRLTSREVPTIALRLQQVGDTLHVRDTTGKDRRFVRRPWGCLGADAFGAGPPRTP